MALAHRLVDIACARVAPESLSMSSDDLCSTTFLKLGKATLADVDRILVPGGVVIRPTYS